MLFLFSEQSRSAFEFPKAAPHLAELRGQMRALVRQPTEVELYGSLTD